MSLGVTLSPTDLATVQQQELSTLPEYYSAASSQYVEISRDFEAFLILSSSDLKNAALNWIQTTVDLQKKNKLRDDLTALAVQNELTNAQAKIAEYNTQLNGFGQFRTNFQANSTFASVSEVQLFLTDLQVVIDEMATGLDRATFDQTICQVIQRGQNQVSISQNQIQELQSWTSVISTYLTG
jgi:hypothetical protein